MMMMKRGREAEKMEDIAGVAAKCLMLLSGSVGGINNRVFECKTCNRQFPSFQALGGHRASHKKPRLASSGEQPSYPAKPKAHECSICGLEFPIGQALGGHMRRHRVTVNGDKFDQTTSLFPFNLSLSPPHTPIVKKPQNSRRVLCLDLNLTPSENKFISGKVAPAVDCFF